jgi:hypothetical protein
MKKLLIGTALAVFALAPAMGWADCDFHNKASMASSKPAEKSQVAQASIAGKASSPAVAKTSDTRVKQHVAKATKADAATVVAKSN